MDNKVYKPELSNISPKAEIGKDCVIHPQVAIYDDVKIGNRVKIQAFAYIPPGLIIEDDVFIGPGAIFLNDKEPPSKDLLNTVIKRGASIGGGVVILPGITINEFALIGAGSVVTKDVPENEIWCGNPAKLLRKRYLDL